MNPPRPFRNTRTAVLLVAALATSLPGAETQAGAGSTVPSKFRSPEDGWFDVSSFLDEKFGFLPIAMPITEPAVGYGLGGGLAFIDESLGKAQQEFKRPSVTGVFGFGTENGSKGGGVGDMRTWQDGRLQTLAAVFGASVNLDFYGVGEDPILADNPLRYNLEPLGGLVQGKYQLGQSRWFAGLGYAYFSTDVSFRAPANTPGLPDFTSESNVGGLLPSITYDTRDNIFTPTNGLYLEASCGVFSDSLGSDESFERGTFVGMYFLPLAERLFFGVRGQAAATWGDPPFYLQPYIQLRGAPAMRYQGEEVAQIEGELRWQFWKRLSLVGFAGTGVARGEIGGVDRDRSIVTGGTGFRYEIARKYGIHMGLDVAWGPDDTAIYVQVGSAWMRP